MVTCQNWMLNDLCREMCVLSCKKVEEFVDVTESTTLEECVRDPQMVLHTRHHRKGSLNHPSLRGFKQCGVCRGGP
ncbi:hypothetical protein Ahy_B06g082317 isoform B [Arachis hypogaea]|uniref:Uncharacterized protein n=1 Tax=Arachis hypogaea TaxID=3818 RepID=A0A444YN54_ARAHY|nr:hypothetical protein Ahy_B06g082317 isoform B [Arachis hypogaea]